MKCLNCGGEFSDRRSDSIYCSDKCGWTYRNNLKKINYQFRNQEVKKLMKSANIFEYFDNQGIRQIPKEVLKFVGFNFDLTTSPVKYNKEKGYAFHKLLEYWIIIRADKEMIEIQKIKE